MMTEANFLALVSEIERQGYDHGTAVNYAVQIGDTPEVDDAGNVMVRDEGGSVIASLRLLSFSDQD